MHETLKNITYLGKKMFFLGANVLAPKSARRGEKQPVLGPESTFLEKVFQYFTKKKCHLCIS